MPPKASSSKRKASKADVDESEHEEVDQNGQEDDSQDNGKSAKANKKAKTAKEPVKPLDASLPTNITFPINLTLEPKPPGTTRLSTWNVCGINSCIRKGFDFYVKAEDPDILIVTETKTDKEVDSEVLKSRFPYRIWGADPKKGQSGTAIFSKIKPKQVKLGLPTLDEEKTQGRCITLEFEKYYLVATYTPNAGDKLKNIEYKKEWNEAFEKYLRELDAKKPVIWGGDFNCAPTEKDIRHAKPNWDKTPGYTKAESDGYFSQLNPLPDSKHQPLIDVWREKHPDAVGQYTYYSYRFKCREKGIGWRLDSFILSKRIASLAKTCEIRHECYGASDHVPVFMDLEGTL